MEKEGVQQSQLNSELEEFIQGIEDELNTLKMFQQEQIKEIGQMKKENECILNAIRNKHTLA